MLEPQCDAEFSLHQPSSFAGAAAKYKRGARCEVEGWQAAVEGQLRLVQSTGVLRSLRSYVQLPRMTAVLDRGTPIVALDPSAALQRSRPLADTTMPQATISPASVWARDQKRNADGKLGSETLTRVGPAATIQLQPDSADRSAQTLLSSSMAEHPAVNRRVVGSSPT